MKKILVMSIVFIMVSMLAITVVNAVTASSVVDDVYALGKKYGFTEGDKAKADRYIKDNPITDEQAQAIYAKAEEAAKVLEEAGATDVNNLDSQLNADQKQRFKDICQAAADILGLKLVYVNGDCEVYKDGKKIDVYTFEDDKLAYTGNNVNIVLVVSSIAVVAIAVAFAFRKKFINA